MPTKKPKRSVGGRPIGSVNAAAWKRFQEREATHGRSVPDRHPDEVFVGVSEGDGTAFTVKETNLDDGTINLPPRTTQVQPKGTKTGKPREIGLDALTGWTDNQPWWVKLPMYQFVITPLWSLKLLFWMFAMGFVLYFMSGGGAP